MKIESVVVRFDKLLTHTDKAILIEIGRSEYWLPKKMCRNLSYNNKLSGKVSIPGWLYREKFDKEPNVNEADVIIEHHIPKLITPVNNSEDESLIR